MARIQPRTSTQQLSNPGRAAPWVAFTAILVLAMIAGLAALLIAMQPDDGAQINGLSALRAPSLPAYKMPPVLPLRPR
jgi:hypothetical protein